MYGLLWLTTIYSSQKGNTALHVVASQGHTEMARLILSTKKANVNIQNNAGDTPLHDGIRSFSVDVVQLLVDTKNCENVKNKVRMNGTARCYCLKHV